jgi:hypothetical protein
VQGLGTSPQLEATIGSWPGAGGCQPTALDAELPDFRGKPVRTGSNLATMAAAAAQSLSRTGSFSNGLPVGGGPSAAAMAAAAVAASGGLLSREHSFSTESFFNACNSAPITPRTPITPLFDLAGGGAAAAAQLDAMSSSFGKVCARLGGDRGAWGGRHRCVRPLQRVIVCHAQLPGLRPTPNRARPAQLTNLTLLPPEPTHVAPNPLGRSRLEPRTAARRLRRPPA